MFLIYLNKAMVVPCFSAIVFSTGFSNTIGSLSFSVNILSGLSGDPSGEYAVTTIPKMIFTYH